MKQSSNLREVNRRLLEQLKKTQSSISQQIAIVNHSDARILSSMPLTSTIVNNDMHKTFTKSSRKAEVKANSPVKIDSSTNGTLPSKYPIISQFLRQRSEKEQDKTRTDSPKHNMLLAAPGNDRLAYSNRRAKVIEVGSNKNAKETASSKQQKSQTYTTKASDDNLVNAPPLLGYDWVAGVVDNRNTSMDFSDSYLEAIQEFRKTNHAECHGKAHWNELMRAKQSPSFLTPKLNKHEKYNYSPDPSDTKDPSVVNFTVNKRLFMMPMDVADEGIQPGTATSPRYVRVSIPKQSLISPQNFSLKQPHRPPKGVNTLALPDHCEIGWKYAFAQKDNKKKIGDNASVDLWSSVQTKETLTKMRMKACQTVI